MLPFGVTGPTNGFPGTKRIKTNWKKAKQARIFQAVEVPKKRGTAKEPRVEKKPFCKTVSQKVLNEPSRWVAVYQKMKIAGGQRVKKNRGTKERWIHTGTRVSDIAIFSPCTTS